MDGLSLKKWFEIKSESVNFSQKDNELVIQFEGLTVDGVYTWFGIIKSEIDNKKVKRLSYLKDLDCGYKTLPVDEMIKPVERVFTEQEYSEEIKKLSEMNIRGAEILNPISGNVGVSSWSMVPPDYTTCSAIEFHINVICVSGTVLNLNQVHK